ncbi:MAG: hypothetical protein Q9174_004568 [Haloplaca sp. 1 TL-2023]
MVRSNSAKDTGREQTKKRKLSKTAINHPPINTPKAASEASPNPPISPSPIQASHSSPSKRQKVQQPSTPTLFADSNGAPTPSEQDPQRTSPQIMSINEMYNFAKPNLIDLTNGRGPATMTTVQKRPMGMAKPSDSSADSGPKRLVVKNIRKTPRTDPEEYVNHVMTQLEAALSAIVTGQKLPASNEELYKGAENLCRQGRAAKVFKSVCDKCRQGVSSQIRDPLVKLVMTSENQQLLSAVMDAWNAWNGSLVPSTIFEAEISYLLHTKSLPSIEEMGINEFQKQVFSNPTLKPRILDAACGLVTADRQGNQSQSGHALLRQVIQMFHKLSVYTSDFEPELLGRSSAYIASWAEDRLASLNLPQYIRESQVFIDHELNRCDNVGLDTSTRISLETYLEDLLVGQGESQGKLLHASEILQILQDDDREALKSLYSLLQRKGLGEKLRSPFESHISEQGSQIVFDEARESEMVVRLLDFKTKLDSIWRDCFASHEGLGHSLREAFEAFINKAKRSNMTWGTDNPKPGEMIAKHVDMILKGGVRAPSTTSAAAKRSNNEDVDMSSEDEDVEINKQLHQVLELFRFVHGKAVFEAFYKRDLARRLLLNRSASADAEKSMLTRLKSECGAGFTHNLEQMFKDMELAREEVSSYKSWVEEKIGDKDMIDLNVSVLSVSAWPSYPDVPLIIPRDVEQAAAVFEHHYKGRHTGRRLTWKHSLAHCQLKASLPKGNKEFVVSSYQAVVLLLFKDKSTNNEVAYNEIQAATGLEDVELKRTLQSLACAKYRVLSKTPKGKDVNDTDTFSINSNFSDPKYRIKINQIQAKETKEENKETHERVAADRAYETQAAIVRIMKAKKTISHAVLVSEVIGATKNRGQLDPADIKKNIERLIDKEYMEREEGNMYTYLA